MHNCSCNIAHRYLNFRTQLDEACVRAGRDAREICLIAVSKGHQFDRIKELYDLGQRDFGESYAQEFHDKYLQAKAQGLAIKWHFIGALQSNKLKLIKDASVIHSIGSVRNAEMLSRLVSGPIDVYIQINLAGISSRHGVNYDDAIDLVKKIKAVENINILGLMTILPIDSEQTQSFWFHQMAALRDRVIEQKLLDHVSLSMGMSDDFITAIHFGATCLRIGTALFGPRS